MKEFSRRTLLLVLLPCLATLAAAGEETFQGRNPEQWLSQMSRAFTELNYDGIFSYYSGSDLSSLRVVHAVIDGVQRERLVHLNGALREIVRDGDEVACILQPGDEILALEGSIPSGPFARAFTRRFEAVNKVYTTDFHGVGRVADRTAIRLAITPVDTERFGYRLWLDESSGLLLRSELLDNRGNRLEIFQFSRIDIDQPISEESLQPQTPSGSVISHLTLESSDPLKETVGDRHMHWRAGWLPPGFEMDSWDIRHAPNSKRSVNTLMYSDGLAAISVFIEDMPPLGAGNVTSRSGATVVLTQMIQGPDDTRHLVTVAGEVPTETARKIAQSIEYQKR